MLFFVLIFILFIILNLISFAILKLLDKSNQISIKSYFSASISILSVFVALFSIYSTIGVIKVLTKYSYSIENLFFFLSLTIVSIVLTGVLYIKVPFKNLLKSLSFWIIYAVSAILFAISLYFFALAMFFGNVNG